MYLLETLLEILVIFGDKFENICKLICPKNEILVTDLTHFANWSKTTDDEMDHTGKNGKSTAFL